jgi:hypothetical protein
MPGFFKSLSVCFAQPVAGVRDAQTKLASQAAPAVSATKPSIGTDRGRAPDGRAAKARQPLCLVPGHVLKPVPYMPKKREHNRNLNLNGRVSLEGEAPDVIGDSVAYCRNFAIKFAQYAGKKGDLVERFSTEAGVRNLFRQQIKGSTQDYLDAIRTAPPHTKHFVHEAHFGKYLSGLAGALKKAHAIDEPTTSANSLLSAGDHVMAVHVERKTKNNQIYYAVKVFDPNRSGAYKRITVADPKDLENLQLKDLMVDPKLLYAAKGEGLSFVATCLEANLHANLLPTECLPVNYAPGVADISMAQFGQFHAALSRLTAMLGRSRIPAQELFAKFESRNSDNFPSLYMASQSGDEKSIQILGGAIASSHLPSAKKLQLLETKSPKGHSGLYAAIRFGHANVIRALAGAAASAQLTSAEKRTLLEAAAPDGVPALYRALLSGDTDVVKAFGDATQMLLPGQDVFDLVAARQPNGTPGVIDALFHNHLDAAVAGCKLLTQAGVPPQKVLDLLQPYDTPELPLSPEAQGILRSTIAQQQQRLRALG